MKTILTYVAFIMLMSNCGQAQKNTSEKEITAMLKEFYTAYNSVWTTKPALAPDVLDSKLHSLIVRFCTARLADKAKTSLEDGIDLLTNNLVSVNSNENLKVEKILTQENEYIVSFVAANSDTLGKLIRQQVTIHVTVVKEGDSYKIDSVK